VDVFIPEPEVAFSVAAYIAETMLVRNPVLVEVKLVADMLLYDSPTSTVCLVYIVIFFLLCVGLYYSWSSRP